MIFKVYLLAFCASATIREVEVPDERLTSQTIHDLGQVFLYGQNDISPVEGLPSLSVGDVIEMDNRLHLVMPFGFDEMHPDIFKSYRLMDCSTRYMYVMQRNKKRRQEGKGQAAA